MDARAVPRTILLVEDEAVLAMEMAAQLRQFGYLVEMAYHGQQALKKLNGSAIDLVLLDVDLGDNSPGGIEVARQILSQRNIPIVFLSGNTEPELVTRIETITSYGYVVKSANGQVLEASIEMALRLYRAGCLLNEREASLQKALADQQAASEAYQQKSDELEMFFENAHTLLCFADIHGYFRRVNREWERVLGYRSEELNGSRFLDFVHPDDLPATLAMLQELAGQKPVRDFVNRYRCRDGSYRWIEWRSKAYGELLMGVANDITERMQFDLAQGFLASCASRGRQFFEELARYLGEHLNMDYVCIDRLEPGGLAARTLAFYADGKIGDNFCYTLQDTPCGMLVDQQLCCVPRDVRRLFPRHQLLQDIGAESYAGVTLFDSLGRPFGLIAMIGRSPLLDPRPVESILRLVGVRAAVELERAQAEEALRASEERYRALIDISPDPICVTDLAGKFTMVNRAALEKFGYSSLEELQASGLTAFDCITEADRARATEHMKQILRRGALHNVEYLVHRRDGTQKWTEISAALLRDADGRPVAFIGITHDISERKRALDEKSTLLRDLQHRIKNSLALINSLIMLEREHAQQPETRKSLNEIYDRVSSLAKLYNILYESQNIQQVDLAQYLAQVAQSLSSSYHRKGVEIKMDFEPVLIDVRMATPFGLVLNELLTNALKYAFPGERTGEIWIGLRLTGGRVQLEVCDNGVGLPAGGAVKDHSHGLGLQLVDLLVSQLRGSLTSQGGECTRFVMEVPYTEVR